MDNQTRIPGRESKFRRGMSPAMCVFLPDHVQLVEPLSIFAQPSVVSAGQSG